MDRRHVPATQNPLLPQRAVSGSYTLQHTLARPQPSSRLAHARSASQPLSQFGGTAGDGLKTLSTPNRAAIFWTDHDSVHSSPDPLDLDDDLEERPAKRAKLTGTASGGGSGEEEDPSRLTSDTAHHTLPGSPLPQLRRPSGVANIISTQNTKHTLGDRSARRPNGSEPPLLATKLPSPRNIADFFPWTGNHPEDILSETVIKAGYSDKAPGPNSTESNSARAAIWPNLSQKNNMGLQTLSYLFTSVMEKRQAMGKCTAPSTFKPPPRVTVTDSKREAWLRDLANMDVPLRKQSRTIPHGIRGKLLMEQCLAKIVPMPRAVWLAKCVGANELRAYRRKGVSGSAAAAGERKWIQEWTVNVEQFLEDVIALCGQPDWQFKMDYALKLATSFYSEGLMERAHYLEWMVTSFSQALPTTLPTWMIFVQLYWKDLTAFERRARQLAEAILKMVHRVSSVQLGVHSMLEDRLRKLILILAVTNQGSLVLPKTWHLYKHLLEPLTSTRNTPALVSAVQNILRRNSRLAGPLLRKPDDTRCALSQLYGVLDSIGLEIDFEKLITTCLSIEHSIPRIVCALINWSASVYRTGDDRNYLAAKLILELHDRGHEIVEPILDYLASANTASLHVSNVHRVVVELVRSRCFSVGRYLQWVMTSGVLHQKDSSGKATGLLLALPLDCLQQPLINLRKMLISRLGHVSDESAAVEQLASSFNGPLAKPVIPLDQLLERLDELSISGKLQFSQDISARASMWAKEGSFDVDSFCALRSIVERCNDLEGLVKVVRAALSATNPAVLAIVCDTVNWHARSLMAVGHLKSLLESAVERYSALRVQHAMVRSCIVAMTALLKRVPGRQSFLHLLEDDLAYCETQTSMAVCSPASDNLVSMQTTSLDSDDEIDAVFASGNTMDEQLMQRVFLRIIQRAGRPKNPEDDVCGKICGWFTQLRAVDSVGFELLTKKHIHACFRGVGDVTTPLRVMSAMVASACISLETVVSLALESKLPTAASVAIQLLTSKHAAYQSLQAPGAFRFRTCQRQYVSNNPRQVEALLVAALDDPKCAVDDDGLIDTTIELASKDQQSFSCNIYTTSNRSSVYSANCERLIKSVLKLADANSTGENARLIVLDADPLSIVHHSAALSMYIKSCGNEDEEVGQTCQDAILEAITNGCEVWPQLLQATGRNTVHGLYLWARDRVLNDHLKVESCAIRDQQEVERTLHILDISYHTAHVDDAGQMMPVVTDKLRALESWLSSLDRAAHIEGVGLRVHFLQLLLHLSILYSSTCNAETDTLKQSRASLLAVLCSLLVNDHVHARQHLLEYVSDVAAAIADGLPVHMLSDLAKHIGVAAAQDPRLIAILGYTRNSDAWLGLASHAQATIVNGGGSAAASSSQPVRAILAQTSAAAASIRASAAAAAQKQNSTASGKITTAVHPFPLRRWEMMGDATPTVGDNDTSLSLALFGARKAF